tara:strand:- start:170 stop:706 length:537 start_codon:yes stop_codon:yes gene_type:complete
MITLPFNDKSFYTIYADPPWNEVGGGQIRRGADKHYSLMKTKDIIEMKYEIYRVSHYNAHLYLWVTNSFLQDGLTVMKQWGFNYKTTITWVKDRIGLGQYFRGITEHCLFGVKGNLPYQERDDGIRAQGQTVIHAPRTQHSVKPQAMRDMIELVSYPPFLELFAREENTNWSVWGNEV